MQAWNEIRTAAYVARLGTISAAAAALGVHRATVTRHIDALEGALGAKLFQRHARGFTPTELGAALLRIADATDAQFGELQRIAKGSAAALDGTLTITSLDVLVPILLPTLNAFQAAYPNVVLRLISSDRVLKLEYGEADIAFRIGPKPQHPDNVILPVTRVRMGLYARPAADLPATVAAFPGHRFVGPGALTPGTPYFDWLAAHVRAQDIRLTSNSVAALWEAVKAGSGIGFLPRFLADGTDLVELIPPEEGWHEPVWAVTHRDLHRSAKVQAFVRVMKRQPHDAA